jgi:hypothetical protein
MEEKMERGRGTAKYTQGKEEVIYKRRPLLGNKTVALM